MDAQKINDLGANKKREYTLEDLKRLPDDVNVELIDGRLYMMATPSSNHQYVAGRIFHKILSHIEARGGSCEPYIAPFSVFLDHGKYHNHLEPDISVICDKSKIKEDGCHGAPDWVIEVISPSTAKRDYLDKRLLYRNGGVREYWIVDVDGYSITKIVYASEGEEEYSREYKFSEKVESETMPGLEIDFNAMDILRPQKVVQLNSGECVLVDDE